MLETSFIGKVKMNWILKGAQSLLKEGEGENLFRQRKEVCKGAGLKIHMMLEEQREI